MLIIAVTSYVAIFWFGIATHQIYAMDIGLTQGQTEVVINQNVVTQDPFVSTATKTPIKTIVQEKVVPTKTMIPTPIDIYMDELFELEASFPWHTAFNWNNRTVLEFSTIRIKGKSVEKQMLFLGKLVEVLDLMTQRDQLKYGVDSETLIPVLQFMIIKWESSPVSSGITNDSSINGQWIFSKFNITRPLEGMVAFTLKEEMTVKRLNIYVNKEFLQSCDKNQCKRFSIYADAWDTISIYHTLGDYTTVIDEYSL